MSDRYLMTTEVRAWKVTEDGEVPEWIFPRGRKDRSHMVIVNVRWERVRVDTGDWIINTEDGLQGVTDDWFRAHCAPVEGEDHD